MTESLREVPAQPAGHRVILLGQEADIIGQPSQSIEDALGLGPPPLQRQIVGEPERARQEPPLAPGQPVDLVGVFIDCVPANKAVAVELAPNGIDGTGHPVVGRREEPDQRYEQKAGIDVGMKCVGVRKR